MISRLKSIQKKLFQLKEKDHKLEVFGANIHKYQLRKPLQESELLAFEQKHQITLAAGYRAFLKHLGNGGAGPYYGLEPLAHTLFASLSFKNENDLLNPSLPFPHQKAWNIDFEKLEGQALEKAEDEYDENKWVNGSLSICNYGCGVSLNLVVNGPEYGHLWYDDRSSEHGIHPVPGTGKSSRIDFLDWYEGWLDGNLKA